MYRAHPQTGPSAASLLVALFCGAPQGTGEHKPCTELHGLEASPLNPPASRSRAPKPPSSPPTSRVPFPLSPGLPKVADELGCLALQETSRRGSAPTSSSADGAPGAAELRKPEPEPQPRGRRRCRSAGRLPGCVGMQQHGAMRCPPRAVPRPRGPAPSQRRVAFGEGWWHGRCLLRALRALSEQPGNEEPGGFPLVFSSCALRGWFAKSPPACEWR